MSNLNTIKAGISSLALEDAFSTPLTFPLFSQLPAEIRLQIWKHALAVPRAVEFTFSNIAHNTVSPTTVPSALHVCHEARDEGLKHFNLLTRPPRRRPTYINVNIDTLHITKMEKAPNGGRALRDTYFEAMLRHVPKNIECTIRHLVLDTERVRHGYAGMGYGTINLSALLTYTKLETLSIAVPGLETASPRPWASTRGLKLAEIPEKVSLANSSLVKNEIANQINLVHARNTFWLVAAGVEARDVERARHRYGMFISDVKSNHPEWKVPRLKVVVLVAEEMTESPWLFARTSGILKDILGEGAN